MKYIAACERRTLRGLLAEIKDRWRSDWVPSVGNIAADASGAWGALKPEATGGQPPHLTVAIDAAGLSIFGNVEADRAYRPFRKAWRDQPDEFLDYLVSLDESEADDPSSFRRPWRLSVRYRVHKGLPMQYLYELALDLTARAAATLPRDTLSLLVGHTTSREQAPLASPEIQILRRYAAADVLAADDLEERLVEDARRLEPFFSWVGEPIRLAR